MHQSKPSCIPPCVRAVQSRLCSYGCGRAPGVIGLATVLVALTCWLAADSPPATAHSFQVVMKELDNPRGLAFGDDGALYVAEAGSGGSGPCLSLRGLPPMCAGRTGAVTRLYKGVQRRIVTDLPSYAPAGGEGATGPHDVSVRDRAIYVTIGLGGDPNLKPTDIRAALDPDLGWLIRARQHGTWRKIADLAGYEEAANPDGGLPDSNPYGLRAGVSSRYVTDAGGNTLLRVSDWGKITTLAVFPSRAHGRSTDAVPTAVALGPDGAYYVGELTGAPFTVGAARVYRVVPGKDPEVFLEGFTAIIDLTFGPDCSLYVLQHATEAGLMGPGALFRIAPDGTRTLLASKGLLKPTAVVIAPFDAEEGNSEEEHDEGAGKLTFYISNCGTCVGSGGATGSGEVIRLRP
jgi:hypothetical protein